MNWIERLPEIKGRDLYSQNGEGLILEYIFNHIPPRWKRIIDIGSGDGFILSNSRHLVNLGWDAILLDETTGNRVTKENIIKYHLGQNDIVDLVDIVSIDTDGNDYWILDEILTYSSPSVVVAEFNPAYTDSRAIAYDPDHEWAGDTYYGFTLEAGVKLAEKHGYKVIYQIADMNIIMVRKDLIEGLTVPPVTFNKSEYFKMSERKDWITI